jgi:hypothetical protein
MDSLKVYSLHIINIINIVAEQVLRYVIMFNICDCEGRQATRTYPELMQGDQGK